MSEIKLGPVGFVRWIWRTLTTMRTALFLLFLLAIAAIPGSIYPQRGVSDAKVNGYFDEHPKLAPILDRLGIFDVYGSAWFASIYLLLLVSLVGCIVPRMRQHWSAMRAEPPAAPRNFDALPHYTVVASRDLAASMTAVEQWLRRKRFRVRRGDGWIAAEKGFARETGNLLFHASILFVLFGVAVGAFNGYRGQVIIKEGSAFSNVLAQYDSFVPGSRLEPTGLQPFWMKLDRFDVTWDATVNGVTQPKDFRAFVTAKDTPDSPPRNVVVEVNEPISMSGVSMFLVGHGYAVHLRVKDQQGNVVFDDSVVFLPRDRNFTSDGVVKIPDMTPQLGLQAIFAPTAVVDGSGPHSTYPDPKDPKLFMSAWTGDLGLDAGTPQNVYKLDTTLLKRVGLEELQPGETWKLPIGTVEFVGVERYATFNVNYDPGMGIALGAAVLLMFGLLLMLYVQRRRYWIRGRIGADGNPEIEVAGLTKNAVANIATEFAGLTAAAGKE